MVSHSGVLYIGVTNNLERRVYEHKQELIEGFTKKYKCHKLLYFEDTPDISSTIAREKQLQNWRRDKKDLLIAQTNPTLEDLSLKW